MMINYFMILVQDLKEGIGAVIILAELQLDMANHV